jgi:pimeloyl-ACP methyl ester carboxylesterase
MNPAPEFAVFPKDRVALASDATPIAYTVRGNGAGLPILFLNGWTCSDGYWAGIVPGVIAAGHRAVLLDTRGHGQSGLPRPPGFLARNLTADDVSVDRLARDVVAVLDDAGIERAALAGHSMGVQALFEVYRVAPERVAALLPMAGTFENPVKTFADLPVLDSLYPIADVLFRFIPFELLRPVVRRTANADLGHRIVQLIRVAGPKVRPEHVASHMGQIGELNFSVLWRMMSGLRGHSTADLLPTITAPTLVLAGRRDLFTPPSVQQRMADLVPDAEIAWFDEGGHLLPVEEPDGIVERVTEFLARRCVQPPAEKPVA